MRPPRPLYLLAVILSTLLFNILLYIQPSYAFEWSTTEFQYQNGNMDQAYTGGDASTSIYTFQQAHGWKYGDNFLFVDFISADHDNDIYGELYANFSLSKLSNRKWAIGPIKDFGFTYGINIADDANAEKHLPGIRLDWQVPGFIFFNTLFTAYLDQSKGTPVPKEDDSYMFDIAWFYPMDFGKHSFSITGHMEYIRKRDNEFDSQVASWILAQPQIRYDLGKAIFNNKDNLFVGVEWQYWRNKLGDPDTDENTLQALVVWRL